MDLNTLDKAQLIEQIKRLDAELAQLKSDQFSREFFASIIEHIPIPVAILNVPQPGQSASYVYQFVNSAVAQLNNKSVEQHIGRTLEEILGNKEVVAGIHANRFVKLTCPSKAPWGALSSITFPSCNRVRLPRWERPW